ncbi:MAG: S-layer homology domain-containing protein [Prevotella sp.]
MLSENDRFRKFHGVDAWHKAGYTGAGITIVDGEDHDRVSDGHGAKAMRTIQEFAPDVTVVHSTFSENNGADFEDITIPYIISNHICVAGASQSFKEIDGSQFDDAMEPVARACFVCMSIGNRDITQINNMLKCKYIYGISAYSLGLLNNKPVWDSVSIESDMVDFCGPINVWVPSSDGTGRYLFNGTSCARAVITGLSALVQDMAIKRTGKPLSGPMMYQFLKDCCRQIIGTGKNAQTGWGIPILPDPETVDIWKYWEASEMAFTDKDKIPTYAKSSVSLLDDLGIMQGNTAGEFMPNEKITRAEVAVALANLYRKLA